MARSVFIAGLAAFAVACGSSNRNAQSNATIASNANSADQSKITVQGCLQQGQTGTDAIGTSGSGANTGSPSAAASSGVNASAAGADIYVLMSAVPAGAPSGSAIGTSGTSNGRYILEGDSAELRQNLNHQVEIIGTLNSSGADSGVATSGTTPGSSTATPGTTGSASAASSGTAPAGSTSADNSAARVNGATNPTNSAANSSTSISDRGNAATRLRVDSVKMIAASCTR